MKLTRTLRFGFDDGQDGAYAELLKADGSVDIVKDADDMVSAACQVLAQYARNMGVPAQIVVAPVYGPWVYVHDGETVTRQER